MTSVLLEVSTVVLGESLPNGVNQAPLPSTIAFHDVFNPAVQLAQPPSEQASYAGLLYYPALNSKCVEEAATIPRNLSLQDIPSPNSLIAFAPSSNCKDSYVYQAIQDGARAIILYPINNSTSAAMPPESSTSAAIIPVYFASWHDAAPVAEAMNQYNTDLLDVPYGQNLSNTYAPSDYVRLVLKINRGGKNTHALPDLWILLLIVLGLLCFIVATTSIAMHTHQYLARRDLRRRIALGEVDLEGLGIKRLTVPKSQVESLSKRLWTDGSDMSPTLLNTPSGLDLGFDQTSCAICLDDYESNSTVIRELPCLHIYHPDCIDSFLRNRSSLCPLCKQSVLPKGYIPPDTLLTTATVMRERRLRQRHEYRGHSNRSTATPRGVQLQQFGSIIPVRATYRANTTDLAPDNDEEALVYRQRIGLLRRIRDVLFPSRSI